MSIHIDPSAMRARSRGFGSLSAGMIMRGAVPEHVLNGPTCAVPQPLRAFRDTPWPEPAPALTPPRAPDPDSAPAPKRKPKRKKARPAAKSRNKRRAMTVRLDEVQHIRLRLVSTYLQRSAQDLFVTALEAYLDQLPSTIPGNCACMKARKAPGSR